MNSSLIGQGPYRVLPLILPSQLGYPFPFPTDHFPHHCPFCQPIPHPRSQWGVLEDVTSGSAHVGRCSCPQQVHNQDSHQGTCSGPCPPEPGIFVWAGTDSGHTGETHRDDLEWGDGSVTRAKATSQHGFLFQGSYSLQRVSLSSGPLGLRMKWRGGAHMT